ncbi:hypothetical protein GCM10011490_04670 [Pseudoclavibacter endophyticus]|uniref:Lipid II isoglutaminyl synthase (glutamine-hydrolyzing) subunit GatD n=1 Tax=Pseudoclavibacter endophyticus TaxID=1778590 RepID=A0A6H9WU77_9MICO|nr:cobyric acid synthase [Pseudoclavibacter endophyticus]KAB1650024.1 cobyric acid synthase [Pseudoclavibacter endophyticus]GGA57867.1 hypothetical protein GCM10011490_04670 [Pseudoclavibacter endophyticus]
MSLILLHLYPRELGINGDVGNVTVLQRRGAAYGLDVQVVSAGIGDALPDRADLVHVGSGPLSAIEAVLPDAYRHAERLRSWRSAGVPFLAVSGGWQLLGGSLRTEDGRALEGLGVFPTRAVRGANHAVGETVLATPGGTVAGYVNHNAVTTLDDGASSFGQVVQGFGNLGADAPDAGLEGVVVGSSIGTHLHGTVLALNPVVADGMLAAAIRARTAGAGGSLQRQAGPAGDWIDRVDDYARRAREAIIGRTGARATA